MPPFEERYQGLKRMWIANCSGQNLPQLRDFPNTPILL
jgi:hypothetical protein